jgi:nitroreductase
MDFKDVLSNRYSARSYSEKDVESEKLNAVLGAAQISPSAGNLQSYKIYVVRTKETREAIMLACHEQEFIAQAPVVLVFCADCNPGYKYGERGAELYSVQDATIAAAYAQLAATEQGLGTVWVGAFDPLELSRLLDARSYEVPVAVVPLGYPADEQGAKERKPIEELVTEV